MILLDLPPGGFLKVDPPLKELEGNESVMIKTGLVLLGYLLPLLSPFKVVLALGLLPPKEFGAKTLLNMGKSRVKGKPPHPVDHNRLVLIRVPLKSFPGSKFNNSGKIE